MKGGSTDQYAETRKVRENTHPQKSGQDPRHTIGKTRVWANRHRRAPTTLETARGQSGLGDIAVPGQNQTGPRTVWDKGCQEALTKRTCHASGSPNLSGKNFPRKTSAPQAGYNFPRSWVPGKTANRTKSKNPAPRTDANFNSHLANLREPKGPTNPHAKIRDSFPLFKGYEPKTAYRRQNPLRKTSREFPLSKGGNKQRT